MAEQRISGDAGYVSVEEGDEEVLLRVVVPGHSAAIYLSPPQAFDLAQALNGEADRG